MTRLRPQYIKLDRELIIGIDRDPERAALVGALADYGTRTGGCVVAESIETEAELRAVTAAGVHCGQGFLLGRPGDLTDAPSPIARLGTHAPCRRASTSTTT